MRSVLALPALFLLTTFAPASLYRPPELPAQSSIAFTPVPLDADHPGRSRIGQLEWLGGWELTSNDPRFGGISAMHVEGGQVLAVSDSGAVMRFAVPAAGSPALAITELEEGPGRRFSKIDRDVEAMTVSGPHAWLAFEQHNAVWRYRLADWRSDGSALPPAMAKWPENGGSEAMLRIGRDFLIFSEEQERGDGTTEVLRFEGDPALGGTVAGQLRYRAPAGYRITDAALLPDGRVLYLNRRFTLWDGVSVKLVMGNVRDLSAGSRLEGREIAHFAPPVTIDNMEALSVAEEDGRTVVWMASDDNFSGMQRTLLLKFALGESARAAEEEDRPRAAGPVRQQP